MAGKRDLAAGIATLGDVALDQLCQPVDSRRDLSDRRFVRFQVLAVVGDQGGRDDGTKSKIHERATRRLNQVARDRMQGSAISERSIPKSLKGKLVAIGAKNPASPA